MKIAVVGTGALGSLFGGILTEAGEDVALVSRSNENAEFLRKHGLVIKGVSGQTEVKVKVESDSRKVGVVDLVIVLTKSYHTRKAAENALPLVDQGTTILTLQNGLGNIEELEKLYARKIILAGTTGQGATLIRPGEIIHAGRGPTYIGELTGTSTNRLGSIVRMFRHAGFQTRETTDISQKIWMKVVVNVGINGVTALTGIESGKLLEIPVLREMSENLMIEAINVAKGNGIKIDRQEAFDAFEDVVKATANNKSSMLQDLERGRETEIEELNARIVSLGDQVGIDTPVNRVLAALVRGSVKRRPPESQPN